MNINEQGENTLNYEISDSVLANVAKIAALNVDGVQGINSTLVDTFVGGMSERLGKKSVRGVAAKIVDGNATVDIYLIVKYGIHIPTIARRVQLAIKESVESMIEPTSIVVNVYVESIALAE